jgi:large subunit ribosomal protein L9
MEVILLERVEKLGNVGDVVNVKNGFARNFLIPTGKVLRATNQNKAEFERKKAQIEKENAGKRELAEKEAKKVEDKFIVLLRQAGEDGRLYGSVSSRDISDEVCKLGVVVKRTQIALAKPIKSVGVHAEKVFLHPELAVAFNIIVARTEDESAQLKRDFLNPKSDKKEDEAVEGAAEEKAEKKPKKSKKAAAEETAAE